MCQGGVSVKEVSYLQQLLERNAGKGKPLSPEEEEEAWNLLHSVGNDPEKMCLWCPEGEEHPALVGLPVCYGCACYAFVTKK